MYKNKYFFDLKVIFIRKNVYSLYFFWKHIFIIQYSLFREYRDDFLNKPAQVIELEVMQSND